MLIYLFCYLIIIVGYFFYKNNLFAKKHYCIFMTLVLTCIIGLRNEMMGLVDTHYVYRFRFEEIVMYGWDYVLYYNKDIGFQTLTFLFTKVFGDNFTLYLLCMAFPYVASISYLIYKYSKSPMISFAIFTSLQFFTITFTLMRQVFAMGILILAFKYVIDKKPIKFTLLVLLASIFHQVAILFLVVYPLVKIKNVYVFLCIVSAGVISSTLFSSKIMYVISIIQQTNERYNHVNSNDSTNLTYFFVCLLFLLISLLYFKTIKKSELNYILFKLSALATTIAPLSTVFREASRVSYMFSIFNIILLPNILVLEKDKKTRNLMATLTIVVFMIYFLFFLGKGTNVIPYRFFWQTL
ncbi:EpsG family protein [Priestia megaterium]|uniref:EpsG family protein n=1 Tax=Priestia megaterium TaxID=1404 RepID=UPI0009C18C70|nr:EpsG family protein [Priestia megaterium]